MPTTLPAKLSSPRVGVQVLARPRLYAKLDRGLDSDLTIVVAPAGFGKTVLLANWMAQREQPTGWLSLDANDNPPELFVRHLAQAIQILYPDACRETLTLIHGGRRPKPKVLAETLGGELADLPDQVVLVLDDYHVITNPQTHALVANLIENVPQQVHLILGSRTDPPLPLSRLRLNGLLAEVRVGDVRFDTAEASELLHILAQSALPPNVREAIITRTEGWAAGIRLALLSLQGRSDFVSFSADSLGLNRYVMDYLMDQVLMRQPPALQDLLLKSSILEWMSEPLVKELMDSHDATGQTLQELSAAGLFVELVDEDAGTYQYHDLFRELLSQRLTTRFSVQEIAGVHRAASRWFIENGYIEESVRHALAAGDSLTAARVVESSIHTLLNREENVRLQLVMELLPPDLIETRAPLLLAKAWNLHFETRFGAYLPVLEQAEQLMQEPGAMPEQQARALRGDIAALKSQVLVWQSRGAEATAFAARAIDDIPPTHLFSRGLALIYAAISQHMQGETTAAKQLLREHLALGTPHAATENMRLLLGLCVIQLDSLNMEQLRASAEIMLRQSEARGLLVSKAFGHHFLATVHYEWNDLETAQFHYLAGAALRPVANTLAIHECLTGLAMTYAAQALVRRAEETAAILMEYDADLLSLDRLAHAQSLRASLAVLRGELDSAQQWLSGSESDPPLIVMPYLTIAQLNRMRVLLAGENRDHAMQALALAQKLEADAASISSPRRRVQALAYQALALDALGDQARALEVLDRTIQLAQPAGLIRTFVDAGPGMLSLLERLQLHKSTMSRDTAGYVDKLVAAFPTISGSLPTLYSSPNNADDLFESLTEREKQVLELLVRRLTNQEIADILVISPFTVRRHLSNISDKLGVHGRRPLVERARAIGLVAA